MTQSSQKNSLVTKKNYNEQEPEDRHFNKWLE